MLVIWQDLRDEAMRERHWKRLMRACGRTFVLDSKFCLNDLVKLQLHKTADAVGEIVEAARQELKIDRQLDKIETTWMNLFINFIPFKGSGVHVIDEASYYLPTTHLLLTYYLPTTDLLRTYYPLLLTYY